MKHRNTASVVAFKFLKRLMHTLRGLLVFLILVPVNSNIASTSLPADRIYILDQSTDSVIVLSDSGEVIDSIKATRDPDRMIISRDGSRLITLSKGNGRYTNQGQFLPERKSRIAIIDTQAMEEIWTDTEFCWSVSVGAVERGVGIGGGWYFTNDDNRLVILCEGEFYKLLNNKVKKTKRPKFAELIEIDLDEPSVLRRVVIEREVQRWIPTPDERDLILFHPRQEKLGKLPERDAELVFLNKKTLDEVARIRIPGQPASPYLSPDRSFLYLLDHGHPDKRAKKNVNGTLHIASIIDRKIVRSVDVGSGPKAFNDFENEQLMIVSRVDPGEIKKLQKIGKVTIVRGADLVHQFDIGWEPDYVKSYPEAGRLYAISRFGLQIVDTQTSEVREIRHQPFLFGLGPILVNEEHTKAFLMGITNPKISRFGLAVIDLEAGSMSDYLVLGDSGRAMLKTIGTVALIALPTAFIGVTVPGSFLLMQSVATDITTSVLSAGAYANMVFGPDQKYIYAVESMTKDVTLVNAETSEVVKIIDDSVGAKALMVLPQSNLLAVLVDDEELKLINTTTHEVVSERDFGGNFLVLGEGEGRYAIALSRKEGAVFLLDGESLNVIFKAEGIRNPYQYLLHPQ